MSPRAEEMALSVKCLLHRHEDLNLDPENSHKKPGMAACASNSRIGVWDGVAKIGSRSSLAGQPSQIAGPHPLKGMFRIYEGSLCL